LKLFLDTQIGQDNNPPKPSEYKPYSSPVYRKPKEKQEAGISSEFRVKSRKPILHVLINCLSALNWTFEQEFYLVKFTIDN
jgi:hypothetical protein